MRKLFIMLAIGAAAALGLGQVAAADKPAGAPEKKADAKPAKEKKLPFHGKVKTVDAVGKTFTLGEHTYAITSETLMLKAGQPATFADIKAGEDVAGSYKKVGDKLEVATLKIGKPAGDSKPKK